MLRRRRPGEARDVTVTVDGRGELGGYANYAERRVANAVAADVIRTVQAMGDGPGSQLETAMVVIAAEDIPAGREVRWDYDSAPGRARAAEAGVAPAGSGAAPGTPVEEVPLQPEDRGGGAPQELTEQEQQAEDLRGKILENGKLPSDVTGYAIALTKSGVRRLHRLHCRRCGLVPYIDYHDAELYGEELPPLDAYHKACKNCFGGKDPNESSSGDDEAVSSGGEGADETGA